MSENNIYPIFERMLKRSDHEAMLRQHGVVIWFTGLSGSGKSTLAVALEQALYKEGFLCRLLDGDNIRAGINNNLGFSETDRRENIRRIAEVAKLFADSGIITIASFISPTREIRLMAKEIIGKTDFMEVHISTPIEICEQRDVKGLYKKARAGEIKEFTGISAPFEAPENPSISVDTSKLTLDESIALLKNKIIGRITYQVPPQIK
ncbi:MAG: adenylyl-sulfate kinase [Bacteroidales bacterium]